MRKKIVKDDFRVSAFLDREWVGKLTSMNYAMRV